MLSASAFLYGLGSHELSRQELDHRDAHYQVVITVRAVKASMSESAEVRPRGVLSSTRRR